MKTELPDHFKLTKKENQEIEEKIEPIIESFFNGLLFFITTPIWIYNKIKQKREMKLIKERIKSMTLLEWLFVGLIFGFTILISFLIFK